MRSFSFFLCLVLSWPLVAQDSHFDARRLIGDQGVTVVTDPAISRRCFDLINRRQEKLQMKQRLRGLVRRNQRLQRVTPVNKKTVLKRLTISMRNLERETKLLELKIQNLEELIIRKGCPRINLD